jgi:hypothetical protein
MMMNLPTRDKAWMNASWGPAGPQFLPDSEDQEQAAVGAGPRVKISSMIGVSEAPHTAVQLGRRMLAAMRAGMVATAITITYNPIP